MRHAPGIVALFLLLTPSVPGQNPAPDLALDPAPALSWDEEEGFEDYDPFADVARVPDPFEPWNRIWFRFNDEFYDHAFRPVATRYNRYVPRPIRQGLSNMFQNFKSPVALINSLLQGDLKKAGTVAGRFGLNTVFGFVGFFDLAERDWDWKKPDEDTAQTLGRYGIGPGFYVVWPFLGPSTLRESAGLAADTFMVPRVFLFDTDEWIAITAADYFNENALRIGQYETFTDEAIEPYVALREAYIQNRQRRIEE